MDPEQTFLRVHARLSGVLARLLTPRFRTVLEYLCLFNAVVLLALLVVMHVNFVAQPGCAAEFRAASDAQLIQVKITGSSRAFEEQHQFLFSPLTHQDQPETAQNAGWKFWFHEAGSKSKAKVSEGEDDGETASEDVSGGDEAFRANVAGTTLLHYLSKWSSFLKNMEQSMRTFAQVWRIAGWESFAATLKGDRRAVAWKDSLIDRADKQGKIHDPMYLYSVEKGYLILSEVAKVQHEIRTVNVSICAQNACFGNRWQRFLIDNFVGYDTILMNSLLTARDKGYLYNFQTKELYNLNYLQESSGVSHGVEGKLSFMRLCCTHIVFVDYVVFKFGVLIMSLFVFFTTTMSVSFTLRETQARMLKFTVQLQHHARHRLPTFHLIFIHVFESLVFVPIMIGILFFLFEFFDDQLLAFMVLTLVWLCELFTMISVRTRISMQYFPRFFFLYFMVFHIYFFSYTYGFSYLAFSATAGFMQHLVLFFWNRFEIPALQVYLRRRELLQQQGLHVTSSAILTSAVQVTRLNPVNPPRSAEQRVEGNNGSRTSLGFMTGTFEVGGLQSSNSSRTSNAAQIPSDRMTDSLDSTVGVPDASVENTQAEGPPTPAANAPIIQAAPITAFGSVFPWTLGSPSTALVSFLPIFRDFREPEPEPAGTTTTVGTGGAEDDNGGLRQRNNRTQEAGSEADT
ncbi:membralin isoform X2 [Selaginella moellendorffii]|uniref:membralin isoform X2 n=1 Tax=Selaginella moellendorffii TaxID=88036 RepID=UPI000D1C4D4B|nr:membralin isoform X2 [Selaginella moellendorffii]|eukprot:XP_024514830.1 membralin isoform X2 [Selaginella moellendorffii]